ncbi:MAG: polysaccharide deacetylase family protein [Pedobacter sp.]|uniref:polysaccharide deacetylase family protein n=1 Tax=Pedobacter sp. TaxID=1411316 RepID=UPI0028093763|nr:polysaccharide deacetylase family protein [Pedobacter sp.]MDQ8003182.1 polysaccharide deacetylase family protein [Pedobacter sp.]
MKKQILTSLTKFLPFDTLSSYDPEKLIVPLYHCISDNEVRHVKHLYRFKNIDKFSADLDFLLRHYQPIDLSELRRGANCYTSKPLMLLTFDDGLSQCFDVIAPILLKKAVPAVFFINSAFVDNNDLFYRFKVSLIIDTIKSNENKFTMLNTRVKIENYIHFLKSLKYKDTPLIDDVASKLNLSFDDYLKRNSPYMSTNQIKSLIKSGFDVGAHSVDHPHFRELTIDEQVKQTKDSVTFMCENFGANNRAFAFPFTDDGVTQNFYNRVLEKECDLVFGTSGSRKDRYNNVYQRIPFEQNDLSVKEILKKYLASRIFRKMTGSYYISRKLY